MLCGVLQVANCANENGRKCQQTTRRINRNDILIYQNMQNNCTKFAYKVKGNVRNLQFIRVEKKISRKREK